PATEPGPSLSPPRLRSTSSSPCTRATSWWRRRWNGPGSVAAGSTTSRAGGGVRSGLGSVAGRGRCAPEADELQHREADHRQTLCQDQCDAHAGGGDPFKLGRENAVQAPYQVADDDQQHNSAIRGKAGAQGEDENAVDHAEK